MPRKRGVPTYRLHKPSGLAVVRIAGHDHYLGPHGSPESHAQYQRLLAEWQAAGGIHSPPQPLAGAGPLTVAVLAARYLGERAEKKYQQTDLDTGTPRPTPMLSRVRSALAPLVRLYGSDPAADFGPRKFKVVRAAYLQNGNCRRHANQLAGCVLRCFAWGVEEELVPETVHRALCAVPALEAGEGRETEDVQPVPESHIPPVQDRVLPPVRDLIQFQLLTGCRPGEACRLRPCDLDRAGTVWLYRLDKHKTRKHTGKSKVIFVGPRAQALLRPYLERRQPAEYVFSPREAMLDYLRARGRRGRTSAGKRYSTCSYTRAIREACEALGIPPWHAHQLRRNAATRLTSEIGYELTRIALGHATMRMTEMYSQIKIEKAAEAMGKAG